MTLFLNKFKPKSFLYFIGIFILMIPVCGTFVFGKLTVGVKIYLEKSDQDYHLLMGLIDPKNQNLNLNQFPEIKFTSRMLILGDGFNRKWTQNAEEFHKSLFNPVEIYKTDIDCPKDLDGERRGNLYFKYVNHKECFPFRNQFFDLIVMRYGLCTCKKSTETCGGIQFKSRDLEFFCKFGYRLQRKELDRSDHQVFQFFYEVSRVLNHKNPYSLAFLHGPSPSVMECELPNHECQKLQVLLNVIPRLEKEFPQLDFKLLYMRMGDSFVFQGIYIRNRIFKYLN